MKRADLCTDLGPGADGFTLLEVLVALAILALVFGFAFRVFSQSFFVQERARQDAIATALATDILARAGKDIPLRVGHLGGRTTDGYAWHVDVSPYGPAPTRPGWVARHVTVRVSWSDRGAMHRVQLIGLRLTLPRPGE